MCGTKSPQGVTKLTFDEVVDLEERGGSHCFKTNNIDIVNDCRFVFGFRLPSELITIRVEKFKKTLRDNTNTICRIFCDVALDS